MKVKLSAHCKKLVRQQLATRGGEISALTKEVQRSARVVVDVARVKVGVAVLVSDWFLVSDVTVGAFIVKTGKGAVFCGSFTSFGKYAASVFSNDLTLLASEMRLLNSSQPALSILSSCSYSSSV